MSICRHRETSEDQNVIVSLANEGPRNILSPNVATALNVASVDVTREAREVTHAAPSALALAKAMISEADILNRAGHLVQLPTAQAALLGVLHRRIADARSTGVLLCAGVQPPSILRATAPAPT